MSVDQRDPAEDLMQRSALIGTVRGKGCLQGELARDHAATKPASREAQDIVRGCLAPGLLFPLRGRHRDTLRFMPPFCTGDEQVDRVAGNPGRRPCASRLMRR